MLSFMFAINCNYLFCESHPPHPICRKLCKDERYTLMTMYMKSYNCRLYNFKIRDKNLNYNLVCKPYLQFLYGTYFNSNSDLFIHNK